MPRLVSFGFRNGVPQGFDVVDARGLKNPYNQLGMKHLDGRDALVRQWLVNGGPGFLDLSNQVVNSVLHGRDVAVGCYGGVHRSVAVVEDAVATLRAMGKHVEAFHRELDVKA